MYRYSVIRQTNGQSIVLWRGDNYRNAESMRNFASQSDADGERTIVVDDTGPETFHRDVQLCVGLVGPVAQIVTESAE